MGKRNVTNYLENADRKLEKAPQYDLMTSEAETMLKKFEKRMSEGDNMTEAFIDLMHDSYKIGFESGTRYENNRQHKTA